MGVLAAAQHSCSSTGTWGNGSIEKGKLLFLSFSFNSASINLFSEL